MTSDVAPPPVDAVPPPPPPGPGRGYPVRLEVTRPPRQSRILNFPLFIGNVIRGIVVLPHLIVVNFLVTIAGLLYFFATFAIIFSGKYPKGMYDFYVGAYRWSYRVSGYFYGLYDKYPPFNFDAAPGYPLWFEADYPERSSRVLNFPIFGPYLIKGILILPHTVILFGMQIFAMLAVFVAQFVVLFTGGFPGGIHAFAVGVLRWQARVAGYSGGLTDKYPPFSLE